MNPFMSCVTGLKTTFLLIDWIYNGRVMFEDRLDEVHPHILGRLARLSPPLPDYSDFLPDRFKRPDRSQKYPCSGTARIGCEKDHYKSPKFEMKWP